MTTLDEETRLMAFNGARTYELYLEAYVVAVVKEVEAVKARLASAHHVVDRVAIAIAVHDAAANEMPRKPKELLQLIEETTGVPAATA